MPPAPALTVARDLAAAHPRAQLPCPLCATNVRAANLERHLAKVHAGALAAAADAAPATTWIGVDRKARRTALVAPALWGLAVVGLAVTRTPLTDPLVAVLAATLLVAFAPVVLAALGVLRARLALDGDTLRLRPTLGLGAAAVRLPATVVAGRLRAVRGSAVTSAYADDSPSVQDTTTVGAGDYLRLEHAGAAITVGCPQATLLREHWADLKPGPKRRAWDITLDRATFVSLEYALAARGQLAPRPGDPAAQLS